jgi:hypothetical protein
MIKDICISQEIKIDFLYTCFLLAPMRLSITAVASESKRLNNNADHQSLTVKPGTMAAAHFIIRILITSRNKPSVRIVMGIVRTMRIGFTIPLSSASTTASRIAVTLSLMFTPGSKYETIKAATAVTSILPINFPMLNNNQFVKVFGIKIFGCKLH